MSGKNNSVPSKKNILKSAVDFIANVLYILEALRHNNIMPGLLPGWTRKDIEQLPNFFFSAKDRNAKLKTCYIS